MIKVVSIMLVFIFLFCAAALCQDKDDYKIVKTYNIASPGWWDYIAINNNKPDGENVIRENFVDGDFQNGRAILRKGKKFKDSALIEVE